MRAEVPGAVAANHPALAGHFPGDPVVPGVVILCEVLRATRQVLGADFVPVAIPVARFHAPLRPSEPFLCAIERADAVTLKYRLSRGETLIASGTLRAARQAPRAVP